MRNGIPALVIFVLLNHLVSPSPVAAQPGWAEKMFKETAHDFGVVPRGGEYVHKFTITNIYAVRMEITSIKSGCGCVSATAAKRVLEPRESTTVNVRMDAKRFTGPKTVGVRVSVGPEFVSSAELRVTANSRGDVVFNPGQVSFGSVTRGQTPSKTIDVEYAGALDWRVTEATAPDAPYEVSVRETYRRPGPMNTTQVGYQLKVTLKADAPGGPLSHDVFLKTNDPSSPVVPVLVEAVVQSAVTVSPPALNLGAVKTDGPLIRRVVVKGTQPFRVTAIEGLGGGLELGAPLAVTDAPVQTVTFKLTLSAPGAFSREVKLRTTLQDDGISVVIDGTASR